MTAPIRSIAVIGAGIAGLACATELARSGLAVTLLDKGRRPGGRVATRRGDLVSFNHGAQYATAQGADFANVLADLRSKGQAAPWPAADPEGRRIVFLPGMSALPAAMARKAQDLGVNLLRERHGAFLHPDGSGWSIRHLAAADIQPGATASSGGAVTTRHDAAVLAMPASQAAALLATASHGFAEYARAVEIAPCWAVMARFPMPVSGPDVLQCPAGTIAWAAREGSRPTGKTTPDAWTLHASADWSRTHLEDSADQVCKMVVIEFRALVGAPEPDQVQAHRWRHALVETPIGQPCLWDPDAGIGACGDWCIGGRVEAAFDSGTSLARAILAAS